MVPFPCQKMHQLDAQGHEHLHDVTCCWVWVREKMKTTFPADVLARHDELWSEG